MKTSEKIPFLSCDKNIGGRSQIYNQMFCHKFGIVRAKPAIDNSEPFGFSALTQSFVSLSPKQIKMNSRRNLLDPQNRSSSLKLDKIKRQKSSKESQLESGSNLYSVDAHQTQSPKKGLSELQQVIRSVNVSPSRKDYSEMVNHSLILYAQRRRVLDIGSLTERKKNMNDSTVYPPIIKRSSPSKTIIDFYNLKSLKSINNSEKSTIQQVESPTSTKKKRKRRKKRSKKQSSKNIQQDGNGPDTNQQQQHPKHPFETENVDEESEEDSEESLEADIDEENDDIDQIIQFNGGSQRHLQGNSKQEEEGSLDSKERSTFYSPEKTQKISLNPKSIPTSPSPMQLHLEIQQHQQEQNRSSRSSTNNGGEKEENLQNVKSPTQKITQTDRNGKYGRQLKVKEPGQVQEPWMEPLFPKLKSSGSNRQGDSYNQQQFETIATESLPQVNKTNNQRRISQRDIYMQNAIQLSHDEGISDHSDQPKIHRPRQQAYTQPSQQNSSIKDLYDPYQMTPPAKRKMSDKDFSPSNSKIFTPILVRNSTGQTTGSSKQGSPRRVPGLNQTMRQFSSYIHRNIGPIDYSMDIPQVGVQGYQELRIRLTNIVLKYAIFTDDSLNSLFEQTAQKNQHLDPETLETIFDQVRIEFK